MTDSTPTKRTSLATLREQQIITTPALARRTVLAAVAGAAVTFAGAAHAQNNYTGVTDVDANGRGPYRDRPGFGRNFSGPNRAPNRPYTGYTDRDPTDRAGHGAIPPGVSQRYPYPGERPLPNPGYTGYSDRDPTDLAGHGQRRNQQVRCTDRDPGDPINGGRNCR